MNGATIGAVIGSILGLLIGYICWKLYHKYKGKKIYWKDLFSSDWKKAIR